MGQHLLGPRYAKGSAIVELDEAMGSLLQIWLVELESLLESGYSFEAT